jgi:hypothetical protein
MYTWFFSERVPYFLEEDKEVETERRDGDSQKCESFINIIILEEKKGKYAVISLPG